MCRRTSFRERASSQRAEGVARDQGDVILSWLTRIVVGIALTAVVGFDSLSIAVTHVSTDGRRERGRACGRTGVRAPATATRPQPLAAAEAAADQHGETVVPDSLRIDPDGTVHLQLTHEATTMVVRHLGPLRSWAEVNANGSGRGTRMSHATCSRAITCSVEMRPCLSSWYVVAMLATRRQERPTPTRSGRQEPCRQLQAQVAQLQIQSEQASERYDAAEAGLAQLVADQQRAIRAAEAASASAQLSRGRCLRTHPSACTRPAASSASTRVSSTATTRDRFSTACTASKRSPTPTELRWNK